MRLNQQSNGTSAGVTDSVKRQSNMELLRIIAMLLIVVFHYVDHGGIDIEAMPLCTNKMLFKLFWFGGRLGVSIFVAISGYFMVEVGFKSAKAVRLYLDTTIYGVTMLVILLLCGRRFDTRLILQSLFPIPYYLWWFMSAFIVLYLMSGFLNIFIKAASQKQLRNCILTLAAVCTLLPAVFHVTLIESLSPVFNNATGDFVLFVLWYLIGAYIRLYPSDRLRPGHAVLLGAAVYLFAYALYLPFNLIGEYTGIEGFLRSAYYLPGPNSPLMLIVLFFLVSGFSRLKIRYSPAINAIGAATFGIYMIHDNYLFSGIMWLELLKTQSFEYSPLLVPHALFSTLVVFVLCGLISHLYNRTLGRAVKRLSDRICRGQQNSV